MKDLVVLSSDKNMEHTIKGLISRPQALGIRHIEADIIVHPRHDPGCANEGVAFLSYLSGDYRHGLLMLDYAGSGKENVFSSGELQEFLNNELARSPLTNRGRAIVLIPELEAWIWSRSPNVDAVAGWSNRNPSLRRWLIEKRWIQEGEAKPKSPKEAFQAALRERGKPRSSVLYQQLAEKVSLHRCTDPSFLEFKGILKNWFPI